MESGHVIIGTAGHVDHGKTALVQALTGIDTDTQPEEKARGVTIDVGFAYWQDRVTVIDVPGHERFVKNAVTGASAIDLALFVVAADDGIMPQTREHLSILQLLGIRRGIVALTKTDLVDDPDWIDLVTEELRELFVGTFLEEAPILPVSSTTGAGVDELRSTLEAAIAQVEARADRGAFRLPVDRVFSVAGFGTVVTGTVLAGTVQAGDMLTLQPAGRDVRVRGVQVHGQDVDAAGVGQRAAVNVADLDADDVGRGDSLAAAGWLPATDRLDARLNLLPDAVVPVEHQDRVRVHIGPHEVLARVALLDTDVLRPGELGFVQLRLETPAVAAHGDRYVVRRYSPARTLGGGVILDPQPVLHKRHQPDTLTALRDLDTTDVAVAIEVLLRIAAQQGLTAREPGSRTGVTEQRATEFLQALVDGGSAAVYRDHGTDRFIHSDAWTTATQAVLDELNRLHEASPVQTGFGREELLQASLPHAPAGFADAVIESLEADGQIQADGSLVRRADHHVELSEAQVALRDGALDALRAAGAAPPDEAHLAGDLRASKEDLAAVVAVLIQQGSIERLSDGLLFEAGVLQDLENRLREHLQAHGEIGVSAFRELAGTSRKFAVPLLNHFDAAGVTWRDGDVRRLREAATTG